MSFWTSPNIHPKTKSRFIVTFGTSFFLPNVKSVTKPAVEIATKEYRLMNHYFNFPGLVRWEPIKITFVYMNGTGGEFDTSEMLYEMLNNSGYAPPSPESSHRIGRDPRSPKTTITTPEKASTIANSFGDGLYKRKNQSPLAPNAPTRTIRIQQLDYGFIRSPNADKLSENANVVEEWVLVNPIITNISWGELDYGSDDLIECTLDIKYDWAELSRSPERPIITNTYTEFSR
tara:strand:- start:311 stop:1006 length:696 start_codon:yes stop_codon:yes gene_type:complete